MAFGSRRPELAGHEVTGQAGQVLSLAPAALRLHIFGGSGRLNAIGSNFAGWSTIADSFL